MSYRCIFATPYIGDRFYYEDWDYYRSFVVVHVTECNVYYEEITPGTPRYGFAASRVNFMTYAKHRDYHGEHDNA